MLKGITRKAHLQEYLGKTIAIDAYAWLHRGAYSCALELALGTCSANGFISFCLNRVKFLLSLQITPIFVFDGDYLPAKEGTEKRRLEHRQQQLQLVKQHLGAGNRSEAFRCSQRCVDVTPSMAHRLQQELKKLGVRFIVAPYEADAQLAFLSCSGQVDAIISEDSDLFLFGCKCVLFKMDDNGVVEEIRSDYLTTACEFSFPGMSMEQFRHICILSGCDYLPSIPGIGLKTAAKLMKQHGSSKRVLAHLRATSSAWYTEYEGLFWRVDRIFLHQRIYDNLNGQLAELNPILPASEDADLFATNSVAADDPFLGPLYDNDIAHQQALGLLDPTTKAPFDSVAEQLLTPPPSQEENIPNQQPTALVRSPYFQKRKGSIGFHSASKKKQPAIEVYCSSENPAPPRIGA